MVDLCAPLLNGSESKTREEVHQITDLIVAAGLAPSTVQRSCSIWPDTRSLWSLSALILTRDE